MWEFVPKLRRRLDVNASPGRAMKICLSTLIPMPATRQPHLGDEAVENEGERWKPRWIALLYLAIPKFGEKEENDKCGPKPWKSEPASPGTSYVTRN